MVSLPDNFLAEMDTEAQRVGTTRCAVIRGFADAALRGGASAEGGDAILLEDDGATLATSTQPFPPARAAKRASCRGVQLSQQAKTLQV
jgi:hypothetical protein